jgi:hypothetical protein
VVVVVVATGFRSGERETTDDAGVGVAAGLRSGERETTDDSGVVVATSLRSSGRETTGDAGAAFDVDSTTFGEEGATCSDFASIATGDGVRRGILSNTGDGVRLDLWGSGVVLFGDAAGG